jgi:hypothetical protein
MKFPSSEEQFWDVALKFSQKLLVQSTSQSIVAIYIELLYLQTVTENKKTELVYELLYLKFLGYGLNYSPLKLNISIQHMDC